MNGDLEQLSRSLQNTLSPDAQIRADAEKVLASAAPHKGFLPTLLQIVATGEAADALKLSAAVQLKNSISMNWSRNAEEEDGSVELAADLRRYFGNTSKFIVDEGDKEVIRGNIVEALARSQQKNVRKTLAACVRHIAREDFPAKWPGVVETAVNYIKSGDPSLMHAGVLTVDKVINQPSHQSEPKDRETLNALVAATFPIILDLVKSLLSQKVTELYAAELIKLGFKMFFKAIQFGIPPLLMNEGHLEHWAQVFSQVLELPLDGIQPSDEDLRPEFPWWKAKRRAGQCLSVLLSKYGFKSQVRKDYAEFTTFVSKQGGIAERYILPAAVFTLKANVVEGKYCTARLVAFMLLIVEDAIEHSSLFAKLKPDLKGLIGQVLIPMFRWSQPDLEQWKEDPQQLVFDMNALQFEEAMGSARGLSSADDVRFTLEMLCRMRKRYALPVTMELVGTMCSNFQTNPNSFEAAIEKAAALRVLECVSHVLRRDKSFNVEQLMMTHVIPDFSSPFPFLRYCACRCLASFIRSKWSSEEVESKVAQSLITLLGDQDLVVRVEAASRVATICSKGTVAMSRVVLRFIPDVVQAMLSLTQQVDVDIVFSSLQTLIAMFPMEVLPYGRDLCKSLVDSFIRIIGEVSEGGDDEDIQTIAAASDCIDSLDTLLSAFALDSNNVGYVDAGRQVLREVSSVIQPLLSIVIGLSGCIDLNGHRNTSDPLYQLCRASALEFFGGQMPSLEFDTLDYLDKALHMMHLVAFHTKSVPPIFWKYVPAMTRVYLESGEGFALDILSVLESLIHYDPNGFQQPGVQGVNHIDLIQKITTTAVEKAIQQGKEVNASANSEDFAAEKIFGYGDSEVPAEAANASYIVSTMFQVCSGSLDNYVQPFVDLMLLGLTSPVQDKFVLVNFVNVVQSVIFYDTRKALQALGPEKLVLVLRQSMDLFEDYNVIAEHIIAELALIKILSVPSNELPPQINAMRPELLHNVSRISKKLTELREAAEKVKKEREAEALKEKAEGGGKRASDENEYQADYDSSNEDESLFERRRAGPTDVPEECNVFEYKSKRVPKPSAAGLLDGGGFGGDDDDDLDDEDYFDDSGSLPEGFEDMTEEERMDYFASQIDFDDDDEEDDDNEEDIISPLDHFDESTYLFQAMSHAPAEARTELEKLVSLSDPETAQQIQKMLTDGQQRASTNPPMAPQ